MSIETDSLLQQFIPEARELLQEAGRSLLALERDVRAAEPMNALFRAVHTLKGTSGLFEIGPLTSVVHAAEDLLCALQAGEVDLAPELADLLLSALDEVGGWIDALSATGELPVAAEAAAAVAVARLRAPLGGSGRASAVPAQDVECGPPLPLWLDGLSDAERAVCAEGDDALIAISYAPDPTCFFRGEDPLSLMRQIDGLRLLRLEPVAPWPALDLIDPFHCNLRLHAIAAASRVEIMHLFRYVEKQVVLVDLPVGWAVDDTMARLLDGQRRLLTASHDAVLFPARAQAAAHALRSLIRHAAREELVDALEDALARSLENGEPAALLGVIEALAAKRSRGPAAPAAKEAPDRAAGDGRSGPTTTLRVEQSKIDVLMNLIGELVVAKNALAYLARRAEDGGLGVRDLVREIKGRHALVNRIAEDMQAAVMAVRMVPVDHVFQRFPRLVRDTARRLGKQIELVLEGGETEADKNVIEALADPLIHMLRNSLDHGIEPPADRAIAGKPEHGTVRLQALHDNDRLVIRLSDDGRGIDPERVRTKAVEKGLIDAERALALSDDEAAQLVFAPGFSTAPAVSDLSGRGVGMDVVRSAVEKAGGRVTLSSKPGCGTTVELLLPLSMAVSRIMTIACGDCLFGVPMALVVETVRIQRDTLHRFRDREAFVLRDSVVPVVRLAHLLDLPQAGSVARSGAVSGSVSDAVAILVVRLRGERLGIVVDTFRDGMEVIVRPMDGVLAGLRGFAGTTLLGDGRVLLILDLPELVA